MSRITDNSADPAKTLLDSTGPFGRCEFVLETVLARLFFFEAKVYKWYRRAKAYYGDLTDPVERERFFRDDFTWNREISPEIYSNLVGLKYAADGGCAIVPLEEADDYLIEMRRIENPVMVSDLLKNGTMHSTEVRKCVEVLLQGKAHFAGAMLDSLSDVRSRGLVALYYQNLEDLRGQLHRAHEFLSIKEADDVLDRLIAASRAIPYLENFPETSLGVSFDCHTDNIVFIDGQAVLIDSMFPRRQWRVIDEMHSISRLAANAAVLGSIEKRDEVYAAYAAIRGEYDVPAAIAHELRTVLMQWSRRHLMGEHERAEKFRMYAYERLAELETLVLKEEPAPFRI